MAWNFGDPCPQCGEAKVWDNRRNKKKPNWPDARCSNQQCTGDSKGTGPWVYWIPKDQKQQQAPAQQAQSSGANTAQQARPAPLTADQFVTATAELTTSLVSMLGQIFAVNDITVSHDTLITEVLTTVRQAWIEHERGVIRLGPEPPAPAQPESVKDRYHRAINAATDQRAVAKLVMGIGGDSSLNSTEKEELANIAQARLETIAMGDQLPG